MKKTNKAFVLAMALTMAGSTLLTGCGGGGLFGGGDDYGDKSVLYVNNYAGGFGSDWLDNVKARFEEEYAEVSLEDGKTGVVIEINHNKDQGENYIGTIDAQKEEVFFPGNIYYHTWVNSGKMLDITDVVEGTNTDGKTILSKMTAEEQAFYKANGKYYAIPHHNSVPGIVYDIGLFESRNLYMQQGGGYGPKTGSLTAGPDGATGTSDDGLPATYDEFFALCGYMVNVGVTPFTWMGNNKGQYTAMMMTALFADFAGVDQTKLNYTYGSSGNATLTDRITIDEGNNVVAQPDIQVTPATGYEVYNTAGRLHALTFLDKLVDAPANWRHEDCQDSPLSTTQNNYLQSTLDTPVAFMPEGNWWENESSEVFEIMALYNSDDAYSKTGRKFGFLPLPKATTAQVGEKMTYAVSEVSLGFIKNSIVPEKVNLAKTFLKYCYTDTSLNEFTATVGLPAALQYNIDANTYGGLSNFGKQMCDISADQLVKPYSTNSIYNVNNGMLNIEYTFRLDIYRRAVTELAGTTAVDYYKTLMSSRYTAQAWQQYSKYF